MEPDRAAHPFAAALRIALGFVLFAAYLVDVWMLGDNPPRAALTAATALAALAITWTALQRSTVLVALAASLLSLLATVRASYNGNRFSLFTEFVILPVLFGVLLTRRPRADQAAAVPVAVAALAIALRSNEPAIGFVVGMSMLVLLGAAATAVFYIRYRDNERRASVDHARQSERLELARELHDVVGHHVTGIVVLAQASRFTASAVADPAATESAMAQIEAAGVETLTSIRRLVGLLRTDTATDAPPGLADIEALVDGLRRTHPYAQLDVDEVLRQHWVPADLATTVQRIAQEAATNVRKHGDVTQPVRFALRRTPTTVELTVENAAVRATYGSGFGVVGMRERVDALGGTFEVSDAGSNWTMRATLPVSVAGATDAAQQSRMVQS